jgi:glycosyltransferase involved in cell wall biosynthesis
MHNLTSGLIESGCEVVVLAMSSFKNPVDESKIPEDYKKKTKFQSVFVDLSLKIFPALYCFIFFKSYHAFRFKNTEFSRKIIEILSENEFDIVLCETVFMTHYVDILRKYSNASLVLRTHNVEHLIWYRIAKETVNPFKKLYLYHLAYTLKKYELFSFGKYGAIASISNKDTEILKSLGCKTKIVDIPFGINISQYVYNKIGFPIKFFHIGAMNWIPNQKGIIWFIENVWKKFAEKHDNQLFLAGRSMPETFFELSCKGLNVTGEVENAIEFISKHEVMIVPIFSGSGIRVKIIEAMALGRIVVTTSIGAEGLNCADKKNIFIADNSDEFLKVLDYLVNSDSEMLNTISLNARKLIETEHNNRLSIDRLKDLFVSLSNS